MYSEEVTENLEGSSQFECKRVKEMEPADSDLGGNLFYRHPLPDSIFIVIKPHEHTKREHDQKKLEIMWTLGDLEGAYIERWLRINEVTEGDASDQHSLDTMHSRR